MRYVSRFIGEWVSIWYRLYSELARSIVLFSITAVEQLADKTVGVQSGSVYARYLGDELVATKLMPAKNLQSYPDIEQAVQDLKRKRIDLVLLDYQPAESSVMQGGVKLVGEELNPQVFSIALPKGAVSLRRVLNQGLSQVVPAENTTDWRKYIWASSRTTSSRCPRRRQSRRAPRASPLRRPPAVSTTCRMWQT